MARYVFGTQKTKNGEGEEKKKQVKVLIRIVSVSPSICIHFSALSFQKKVSDEDSHVKHGI